jgi:hypothetical protein
MFTIFYIQSQLFAEYNVFLVQRILKVFLVISTRKKSFRSFLQIFRVNFGSSTSTKITLKTTKAKVLRNVTRKKSEIKT